MHITKGSKGFELIKSIYNDFANVGTVLENDTYTFDVKELTHQSPALIDDRIENINHLKEKIFSTYRGKSLTARALFEEHHQTKLYCNSHYHLALRALVDEGRLFSKYTDGINHRVTVLISHECHLTFAP